MELYSFFNSSTSYRVRIALALKGLDVTLNPVNIRVLEHKAPEYLKKNPAGGVPLLQDEGFSLGQSMAIIDYLDAKYPEPRLIPQDLQQRARVLEISNLISCDMHPLNNLRVLRYLVKELGVSEEAKNAWYAHWIAEGFGGLEQLLERVGSGNYCVGDQVSLADCCLVPQVVNAQRMGCDLSAFPRVLAVYEHCSALPAFQRAAPAQQPDYQP
ncbi:maleylacetoacetate isomerase [Pusillimonas sp. CC-YST705]|uniref:Maleylacetoacetate isomerase n=1 Tax=Mesopusillimonas faecipullorum TaxID=2755040 RepID=A0ABS8CE96_9BURK|nr:maleylacetoacetate isomerase [Mesopusillimonas faecipullorum]MCB5364362.1 maleylacetoacetate isomerase [Mesopusillimonas faecipullorum]